jgi:GTP-dependent dephospho-CoA kinase
MGRLFKAVEVGGSAFVKAVGGSSVVITVGDRVTETFGRMGRVPDVQIVDGRENRLDRRLPDVPRARTIRVLNPPATITEGAIAGIRDAFSGKKPARVLVEGEEDLLAIPAIVFAPTSAAVFYGQPGVGIVMVRVTPASRSRNRALLTRMGAIGAI